MAVYLLFKVVSVFKYKQNIEKRIGLCTLYAPDLKIQFQLEW